MKMKAIGCVSAAMLLSNGVMAQELNYRLPQATMVAAWQARITHCPDRDGPEVGYVTNAVVAGAPGSGELVRLNPSSPFLGSRKVTLTFSEKGNLKTINAEGQGQGGTILASIFKSVASIAALGVGVPPIPVVAMANPNAPPPPLPNVTCKSEVAKALARWTQVSDTIDAIEADVATGIALGAERTALLSALKEEQAGLEEDLTLTTGVKLKRSRAQAMANPAGYLEDQGVDPLNLGEWLEASPGHSLPVQKVGQNGFCARFSASADDLSASTPIATSGLTRWRERQLDGGALRRERLDRFVYLMPVPAKVELFVRTRPNGDCSKDAVRGERLKGGPVVVPQFSDYFILPIGSGAFESKASSAEFADDGRILSIGTNNTGGGSQFAEALAGLSAGAEMLEGAKTAAIQRRIDRIKAENELAELLDKTDEK